MTEEEHISLGCKLVLLPHMMANLGHTTVKGHAVYHEEGSLFKAYLDWLGEPNASTHAALVKITGGQDKFDRVRRIMQEAAMPDISVDPDAKPVTVAEKQSESEHSSDALEGGTMCLNGVTFDITHVSQNGSPKYGIDLTLELTERKQRKI